MKKYKLYTSRHLRAPHKDLGEWEVPANRISTSDGRNNIGVVLPWEYNPHKKRLWLVGNEHGAMGAVWADNEEEAFDALVDTDLAGGILVDDDVDEKEEEEMGYARVGNAGELVDLTNAWLETVVFDPGRDCELLCAFAEARGERADTLDF